MSLKWHDCELGDVITLKRGYDLPKRNRQPGSVPIVSSSGITDFHKDFKVRAPGVVTGRYGTLGEVFYIDQDFWPLNTTLYVKDFKGNNPRFISYFMKTLGFASQNAAAAVPGVNRNVLHKLPVRIPPLPTQRKIAAVLSAYDDLIENNTRRIALLEEMAQRLYREWFVEYRFPGHESVPLEVDGFGPVPEGWKVVQIGDVCKVGRGSSPRPIKDQKYFEGGNIPWVKIADATSSGRYLYKTKQYVNEFGASFSRFLPKGSLILAASGTLGHTQFLGVDGCIHDGWLYLEDFDGVDRFYLFQLFRDRQQYFFNAAYGAAIQNINTMILREMKIVLPPPDIQQRFNQIIVPVDKLIDSLGRKNTALRQTHDLLLPRLISGAVDVSDLEIDLGED